MSVAATSRITAAIALIFFAGCGDSTHSSTYFPLTPGSSWHYRIERTTMDGTHQLRDLIKVAPPTPGAPADLRTHVTFDGRRFEYKVTDEGIYGVGARWGHGLLSTEDAQLQMVMPAKLALEQQWQGRSATTVLETKQPPFESMFRVEVPIEMHYRVASLDAEVSTPAGVFNNCLLVSGRGSADSEFAHGIGHSTVEVTSTEWYAPNVGLVRMERRERTSASALKVGALVMELDSWHRP